MSSNITEFDEAWKEIGNETGLFKWRIEKFEVKKFPEIHDFYEGDCFIVLHSYKKPKGNTIFHDIYFWLGEESTKDEQGTAAYKTVELDTYLGGAPVQHREVQNHESPQFLGLFPEGVRYLKGGIETGFRHVAPEEFQAKLFHIKGRRNVRVVEVPLTVESLNEGDAFILDSGLTIYQWHGKSCNFQEKHKASEFVQALRNDRKGKAKVEILDQGDNNKDFWEKLGGKGPIKSASEGGDDIEYEQAQIKSKSLWKLSDESGSLVFEKISEGSDVSKDQLDTMDVFILDTGYSLFVWVGQGTTQEERRNGIKYAMEYLEKNNRPTTTPIARFIETGEQDVFWKAFD